MNGRLRQIEGRGSADYLWNVKNVVPFLKVDKGLADEVDGAQVMKPMPARAAPHEDRLPAPLVHQDGGAEGVQRVLEECEVVGAPEQRTALHHHGLDRRTS